MPLVECPECKKDVSSEARACPFCGYPVAEKFAQGQVQIKAQPTEGELLAEVRPSWWGYFWHLFFFWLLIPPIVAIFSRSATVLRVYQGRINVERGIFSKCYQDYMPEDIRSIDIDQSFLQRIVGIGNLTISTSATVEASEVLKSIPDPQSIRELIMEQRSDT